MSATLGSRRQRATPAFRGFHGPTHGIHDAALCAPEIERVDDDGRVDIGHGIGRPIHMRGTGPGGCLSQGGDARHQD